MNRILMFVALVVVSLGGQLGAHPIDLTTTENKVEFLAVGQPSALKIRGKLDNGKSLGGKLEIVEGKLQGVAKVNMQSFDTGIDLRNKHMKEKYLETPKYPESTVTLKPVVLPGDTSQATYEYAGPFEGTLKLHGVEKPIKGELKVSKNAEKWKGSFSFSFELQDYGIDVPKYLGITVSKAVSVEAAFQQ